MDILELKHTCLTKQSAYDSVPCRKIGLIVLRLAVPCTRLGSRLVSHLSLSIPLRIRGSTDE
jgi:hypothetical protein